MVEDKEQSRSPYFRSQWLATQQNHARAGITSVGQDLWKIQIVGQNREFVVSSPLGDDTFGRLKVADIRPVPALSTSLAQKRHPLGCQNHINQQFH